MPTQSKSYRVVVDGKEYTRPFATRRDARTFAAALGRGDAEIREYDATGKIVRAAA